MAVFVEYVVVSAEYVVVFMEHVVVPGHQDGLTRTTLLFGTDISRSVKMEEFFAAVSCCCVCTCLIRYTYWCDMLPAMVEGGAFSQAVHWRLGGASVLIPIHGLREDASEPLGSAPTLLNCGEQPRT